ncbi:hypothetical protein CkaCkLH20_07619 [Colletotrichum karsti]|uniref:Uncharacterized protein n=1 Tax=Colletotrichum karsti TaxID=1095194 RepID=A0A9P6I325_9PEZI|nr:uncharacterized protein CkaCkLH20_07619 [Colletotrichum karsti]KAF9874925.1 hypothetical protein CkaCkLH20_07619 [Colletotrichum karsti]
MCAKKGSKCEWPNNWREPQTVNSFALDSSSESSGSSLQAGAHNRGKRLLVCGSTTQPGAEAEKSEKTLDTNISFSGPAPLQAADKTTPEDINCGTGHIQASPTFSHVPLVFESTLNSDNTDFQLLFQYFIGRSLPSMSVDNVDTQLYVSTLVPLILTDDLVLRSTLAMSSLQYMLSNPDSSHALKLANMCYSKALSAMRSRVALSVDGSQIDRPECLTAASLVLALTEATRGDSSSNHVDFASHVLQNMPDSARLSMDQKLYRNLIRVCMYLRIDSSVVELPTAMTATKLVRQRDMPTLCSHLWEAENRATASELSEECGLFQTPFITGLLTIPHLARLQATPETVVDKEARIAQLSAIEMQIMSWEPALPKTGQRVRQVWTLWRLAMLLLLYESPVDGTFWKPSRRDDCLESFMKELKLVPKGHESFGVMMWPMLMAGSCAQSPEHRDMIQDLLTQACEPLAAQLPAVVANVIQSIWDAHSGDAQSAAHSQPIDPMVIDPRLTSPVSSSETTKRSGE